MYVYIYVRMYVCMYVRMYVCTYVCKYIYNFGKTLPFTVVYSSLPRCRCGVMLCYVMLGYVTNILN
jgi:hypothetical protein